MDCLLHPTYFANIAHYVAMMNAANVKFEVNDNYQKQSYRNRTEIYGANGKLALTVPVNYSQNNRQLYKDVKIANEDNWQQQHLKSLQSAYSMSPFYEYYIDDFMPVFENSFKYILDLNYTCFETLIRCLDLDIQHSKTTSFEQSPKDITDLRHLAKRNFKAPYFEFYTQVFTEKHGFISNLSILDLLFNEGPATALYLKRQDNYT